MLTSTRPLYMGTIVNLAPNLSIWRRITKLPPFSIARGDLFWDDVDVLGRYFVHGFEKTHYSDSGPGTGLGSDVSQSLIVIGDSENLTVRTLHVCSNIQIRDVTQARQDIIQPSLEIVGQYRPESTRRSIRCKWWDKYAWLISLSTAVTKNILFRATEKRNQGLGLTTLEHQMNDYEYYS